MITNEEGGTIQSKNKLWCLDAGTLWFKQGVTTLRIGGQDIVIKRKRERVLYLNEHRKRIAKT